MHIFVVTYKRSEFIAVFHLCVAYFSELMDASAEGNLSQVCGF